MNMHRSLLVAALAAAAGLSLAPVTPAVSVWLRHVDEALSLRSGGAACWRALKIDQKSGVLLAEN